MNSTVDDIINTDSSFAGYRVLAKDHPRPRNTRNHGKKVGCLSLHLGAYAPG